MKSQLIVPPLIVNNISTDLFDRSEIPIY